MGFEKSGRSHPFEGGRQGGHGWRDSAQLRYPRLVPWEPEALSYARAAGCNKEKISEFFGKLGGIFHRPGKVVANLGKRSVYALNISREKEDRHGYGLCLSTRTCYITNDCLP